MLMKVQDIHKEIHETQLKALKHGMGKRAFQQGGSLLWKLVDDQLIWSLRCMVQVKMARARIWEITGRLMGSPWRVAHGIRGSAAYESWVKGIEFIKSIIPGIEDRHPALVVEAQWGYIDWLIQRGQDDWLTWTTDKRIGRYGVFLKNVYKQIQYIYVNQHVNKCQITKMEIVVGGSWWNRWNTGTYRGWEMVGFRAFWRLRMMMMQLGMIREGKRGKPALSYAAHAECLLC